MRPGTDVDGCGCFEITPTSPPSWGKTPKKRPIRTHASRTAPPKGLRVDGCVTDGTDSARAEAIGRARYFEDAVLRTMENHGPRCRRCLRTLRAARRRLRELGLRPVAPARGRGPGAVEGLAGTGPKPEAHAFVRVGSWETPEP
jgi:hypothetical protein